MGGKPRKGYCIVGGVVPNWVKDALDKIAQERFHGSRSKTIGYILTYFIDNCLDETGTALDKEAIKTVEDKH